MKTFTLISPVDSMEISCLVSEPSAGTEVKCVVQFSHGMCEHKERYIPFMEYLSSKGCVCVINDHRGHGSSVRQPSDLGYLGKDGWSAMIEDTKAVTDWVKHRYTGAKIALFGHSMGSMVVRGYAKRYDDSIDALYVCGSPSDNPAKGIGKLLSALFGLTCGWRYRPALLQKMSFGAYNKRFASEGYKSAWICSDEGVLRDYHSDPLCQFVFTSDGFYNLMCLMQYCYRRCGWAVKHADMPIHFISGSLDPCRVSDRDLQNAVNLMLEVGYSNVKLKIYDGMRHEILNETEKRKVWEDVFNSLP